MDSIITYLLTYNQYLISINSRAAVIKPFIDTFDYKPANILSVDKTYIKVKGVKHYVWIVMDAYKKSI